MKAFLLMAVLLIGLLLFGCASQPQAAVVTYDEYSRLGTGITLAQAVDIIGSRGDEISRNKFGDVTTTIYIWKNPDGSNAVLTFQNDMLVSKEEYGLAQAISNQTNYTEPLLKPVCGDDLCNLGENYTSCTKDCFKSSIYTISDVEAVVNESVYLKGHPEFGDFLSSYSTSTNEGWYQILPPCALAIDYVNRQAARYDEVSRIDVAKMLQTEMLNVNVNFMTTETYTTYDASKMRILINDGNNTYKGDVYRITSIYLPGVHGDDRYGSVFSTTINSTVPGYVIYKDKIVELVVVINDKETKYTVNMSRYGWPAKSRSCEEHGIILRDEYRCVRVGQSINVSDAYGNNLAFTSINLTRADVVNATYAVRDESGDAHYVPYSEGRDLQVLFLKMKGIGRLGEFRAVTRDGNSSAEISPYGVLTIDARRWELFGEYPGLKVFNVSSGSSISYMIDNVSRIAIVNK